MSNWMGALSRSSAPCVSVIVRSLDEAPRLRLTLASLAAQDELCEVVVIDDGSSDETAEVITEASHGFGSSHPLIWHRNATPHGRSAAANKGAALAQGDILLFLDGDTLASPGMVAAHRQVQQATGGCIARGETWHLRQTRPFRDPGRGIAFADQAERVAAMSERDLARATITPDMIRNDFPALAARGQAGIYPGYAPRRLYEMEMTLLHEAPHRPIAWAAASGANQSVPRAAFLESGGFDGALTINEHRELALRLMDAGLPIRPVAGARSLHMIHRSGWRDPLTFNDWEDHFFARHPRCEVALLALLWASIDSEPTSGAPVIGSFASLEAAALACRAAGGDALPGARDVRALYFRLVQPRPIGATPA